MAWLLCVYFLVLADDVVVRIFGVESESKLRAVRKWAGQLLTIASIAGSFVHLMRSLVPAPATAVQRSGHVGGCGGACGQNHGGDATPRRACQLLPPPGFPPVESTVGEEREMGECVRGTGQCRACSPESGSPG